MRTIEITTTQNVTIEYELASVRERILAFGIDFVLIWILILVIQLVIVMVMPNQFMQVALMANIFIIFMFYAPVMEIFGNGRSPGKRALGLRVVRVDGMEAAVADYLIRWTFRMVDIYLSLGSVASLLISSTHKAQRLGDFLANTTVIKVRQRGHLGFNDILRIRSLENYVPVYPGIRMAAEADMLLVKNVLDRYASYPNAAHRVALKNMEEAMRRRLGLTQPTGDPVVFLRTLISDYIVLTR